METENTALARFIQAQSAVYERAVTELRGARKETHWMWFVFPQLAGLGKSATSERFGITSLAEARAYLAHPILGMRLRECTQLVLDCGRRVEDVFGYPDDLKFRSCMTLFATAEGGEGVFRQALNRFWDGTGDAATLRLLGHR